MLSEGIMLTEVLGFIVKRGHIYGNWQYEDRDSRYFVSKPEFCDDEYPGEDGYSIPSSCRGRQSNIIREIDDFKTNGDLQ